MNSEQAQHCAAFLGEPFEAIGEYVYHSDHDQPRENADLFMALLLRAQELKIYVDMTIDAEDHCAFVLGSDPDHYGTDYTPLAALVAAVCAYQERQK